ncbi:MAG: SMP-30/gluconolactonase/LRE family protein [Acidobacteriota bacterium]
MSTTASLAIDCQCTLGEAILWSPKRNALLWTDIETAHLWMHWLDDGSTQSWTLPDRMGSLALCASGRLLLGLAKGLYFADIDAARGDSLSTSLALAVEADVPSTRINDGRVDRAGNFVFGTIDEHKPRQPIGNFYQYSTQHGLRRLELGRPATPNSICFSPDGETMYFCDSPQRRIMQCRYRAEAAEVSDVREFATFGPDQSPPDGSTIDAAGFLWNAEYRGGMVRRYSPEGEIDREVVIPVSNVTCPAFGGRQLTDLFVTTARSGLSAEELAKTPHAGGIFHTVVSGVVGLPESVFKDR